MALLLFPDNTVLINFVLMGRVKLLERLIGDRGRWGLAIARECDRSARQPGLEALEGMGDLLGAPLVPTATERVLTMLIRDQFAGPGDPPDRHLGESETLALIMTRGLNAIFVTDDRNARRRATVEGIAVASTWDLLRVGVRAGWVSEDEAWVDALTLKNERRAAPPIGWNEHDFRRWLNAQSWRRRSRPRPPSSSTSPST